MENLKVKELKEIAQKLGIEKIYKLTTKAKLIQEIELQKHKLQQQITKTETKINDLVHGVQALSIKPSEQHTMPPSFISKTIDIFKEPLAPPPENPTLVASDINGRIEQFMNNEPILDKATGRYTWSGIPITKEQAMQVSQDVMRKRIADGEMRSLISTSVTAAITAKNGAFASFAGMKKGGRVVGNMIEASQSWINSLTNLTVFSDNKQVLDVLTNINHKLEQDRPEQISKPVLQELRKEQVKPLTRKNRELQNCQFCSSYDKDLSKLAEDTDPWCIITFPHKDDPNREVCMDVLELWSNGIVPAVRKVYSLFSNSVFKMNIDHWAPLLETPHDELLYHLTKIPNPAYLQNLMPFEYFTIDEVIWIVQWYTSYITLNFDLEIDPKLKREKIELWQLGKSLIGSHRSAIDLESPFEIIVVDQNPPKKESILKTIGLAIPRFTRHLWNHPFQASMVILVGDLLRLYFCSLAIYAVAQKTGQQIVNERLKSWLFSYTYQGYITKIINIVYRFGAGFAIFNRGWFQQLFRKVTEYLSSLLSAVGLSAISYSLGAMNRLFDITPKMITGLVGGSALTLLTTFSLLGVSFCFPGISTICIALSPSLTSISSSLASILGFSSSFDQMFDYIQEILKDDMYTDFLYDFPKNTSKTNTPIKIKAVPTFSMSSLSKLILTLSTRPGLCRLFLLGTDKDGWRQKTCEQSMKLVHKLFTMSFVMEAFIMSLLDVAALVAYTKYGTNFTSGFPDFLKQSSCVCKVLNFDQHQMFDLLGPHIMTDPKTTKQQQENAKQKLNDDLLTMKSEKLKMNYNQTQTQDFRNTLGHFGLDPNKIETYSQMFEKNIHSKWGQTLCEETLESLKNLGSNGSLTTRSKIDYILRMFQAQASK
jgi:hypothetical protein